MNTVCYQPVGRCIYCGSTESLGREHIIPLALNGTAVLPKSTCDGCTRITGEFEQDVLRALPPAFPAAEASPEEQQLAGLLIDAACLPICWPDYRDDTAEQL